MKSLKNKPLVSVIVPTKNSSNTLSRCLDSIKKQRYGNIEILVVDNFSEDNTIKIAQRYTTKIFTYGPERSAQVNYGVSKSAGEYIYKVDSDFVLERDVIKEAVTKANQGFDAIVVHNSPDTRVSWIAKIRKFEVDMYKYDITFSSARFIKKTVFVKVGGFDESITAGEDFDFQNKLNKGGYKTGFISSEALHLGEPKKLWPHLLKYFYYGKDFVNFSKKNSSEAKTQLSPVRSVYLKNWKKFLLNPFMGIAFIFYSFLKFLFGGFGYLAGKIQTG